MHQRCEYQLFVRDFFMIIYFYFCINLIVQYDLIVVISSGKFISVPFKKKTKVDLLSVKIVFEIILMCNIVFQIVIQNYL